MNVFPAQPTSFQDVEGLGPEPALRWVQAVTRGEIDPPADFFWLGLADSAKTHAERAAARGDFHGAVASGRLALAAYDRLAADRSTGSPGGLRSKALMTQARLIQRFGCRDGSDLLSPHAAIVRFRQLVGRSPETVDKLLHEYRSAKGDVALSKLDPNIRQEYWRLREIRIAAQTLKIVRAACPLAPEDEEEVTRWLALAERLP